MRVFKVITTFPDEETAREITKTLVKKKIIACGNIIPSVESIYLWEGKLCEEKETMTFYKTHEGKMTELKNTLSELHPYDVPEIIAHEITEGSDDYLEWVREI